MLSFVLRKWDLRRSRPVCWLWTIGLIFANVSFRSVQYFLPKTERKTTEETPRDPLYLELWRSRQAEKNQQKNGRQPNLVPEAGCLHQHIALTISYNRNLLQQGKQPVCELASTPEAKRQTGTFTMALRVQRQSGETQAWRLNCSLPNSLWQFT